MDFMANPSSYMESFGIRAKRHAETEDHTGFEEYPIPFLGAEVGVKYKDPSDHMKGGEAFLHIDDLQSHIPTAHSKMVKLHVKFDGGASTSDGLFTAELDYHLEHKDGDGIEEGSLTIVREMRGGKWHTNIKTEAHPFSGVPILPTVDHVRGSHIIIDANVGGGIHLEARQTPNSLGGRTINILTSKAGVEMLTYHADTY